VLLILAVGLFATVWAGDHPPHKTVVFATNDAMFVESVPAVDGQPVSALSVCPEEAVAVHTPAVHTLPVEPALQLVHYLPAPAAVCTLSERILQGTTAGIAAGDYLAVAADGTVEPVSFNDELLHQWGHPTATEATAAVTVTVNGRTITLVRIVRPATTIAAR
jgi:hypothetical protein